MASTAPPVPSSPSISGMSHEQDPDSPRSSQIDKHHGQIDQKSATMIDNLDCMRITIQPIHFKQDSPAVCGIGRGEGLGIRLSGRGVEGDRVVCGGWSTCAVDCDGVA
jgi:hypothetical protein